MNSKLGNAPWLIEVPKELKSFSNTMIVGADVYHSYRKSVVGFTCTLD